MFLYALTSAQAKNYLDENLKKLTWNGIDIIWLEDSSLPTYDVSIYFNEGALGDRKQRAGETQLMFEQLTSGTHRYPQADIIEALEYFGASYGSRVTHEYSTFSVSGLVKDFAPTMKMICHLFDRSLFPKSELKKAKTRLKSRMKSIVSNHSALASIAFRYESLKGSGFETPTSGTIKSIQMVSSSALRKRLEYFNQKTLKRIYIRGPKDVLELEPIVKNDCKWKNGEKTRKIPTVRSWRDKKELVFIPVPKANQAQIRIGRIMTTAEVREGKKELKAITSDFLGSGFTSKLFKKLRVEKGLTYSVSSYVSDQYNYGRSGIRTFTKNETVLEILSATKQVLDEASQNIDKTSLKIAKNAIKGNYLIGLESTSDFLQNLLHFDHVKQPYERIYRFSEVIDGLNEKDLQDMTKEIFGWDKQTIVILGNKSLIPTLKKAGHKVRVENHQKYL